MAERIERPPSAVMWTEDESEAEVAGGARGRRSIPPLPMLAESYRDVDSDRLDGERHSGSYRRTPGPLDYLDF